TGTTPGSHGKATAPGQTVKKSNPGHTKPIGAPGHSGSPPGRVKQTTTSPGRSGSAHRIGRAGINR
nr:hypothetical protein [Candidatus Eremiobacteraeota bacterium]